MQLKVKQISFDGIFHIPMDLELNIQKLMPPPIIGHYYGPKGSPTNEDEIRKVAKNFGEEKFLVSPTLITEGQKNYGSQTIMKITTGHGGSVICFYSEGVKYYTEVLVNI